MKVVISPHLDDAVLSYGATIAGWGGARIVTVFAGTPPEWPWPTPFDNASGFDRSSDAVRARRVEDRAACREIGASVRHLGFLDGQYGFPRDASDLAFAIAAAVDGASEVAVPLGLAHPDHRIVAKLCRALDVPALTVYADLPSATLWPGHVAGALLGWARAGWTLTPAEAGDGYAAKHRAWLRYPSQIGFPELAWENLTEERAWIAGRSEE